jgi:hypothetical protein
MAFLKADLAGSVSNPDSYWPSYGAPTIIVVIVADPKRLSGHFRNDSAAKAMPIFISHTLTSLHDKKLQGEEFRKL